MKTVSTRWYALVALALLLGAVLIVFISRGGDSKSSPSATPNPSSRPADAVHSPGARASKGEKGSVASKLAPDLEILEGRVEGETIVGPVVVSGSLPPSRLSPLEAEPRVDAKTQAFKVEAEQTGEMQGPFTVQAASARTTRDGIQFKGPIRFEYENSVGRRYEVVLESEDSYFFISADGQRQLLGTPGLARFGAPEGAAPEAVAPEP